MVKKLKFPFLNFIVIQKGNIVEMTIFLKKNLNINIQNMEEYLYWK